MRAALFFVWFLGVVIGVPALFVAGSVWREVATLEASAPHDVPDAAATRVALSGDTMLPASDATAALPGARSATMALWADGTRLVLVDAGDASGAAAARTKYLTESGAHLSGGTDLLGGRFASDTFTTAAGEQGRLVVAEGTVAIVAGPSDAAVEARVTALRARSDVPQLAWALSAPVGDAMNAFLLRTLGPVLLWALLAVPWFGRMASWAGASPPAPGAPVLDAATLRRNLLALGGGALPFTVQPGTRDDELIVDWRYEDTRLTPALQLTGRRRVHRIVVRLDGKHHVARAQDRHATLDWSADGAANAASLDWRASRGITLFQYEHETELGIGIESGRFAITPKASYTFDLRELKAPVVAIVTRGGWEWRPVIAFSRLLGG
ncbi:hypothetical protein K2Z84_02670 [Candidatus Binatia bacterium]|nr:hypothetical protein [Candidatus Binatia bacterium]